MNKSREQKQPDGAREIRSAGRFEVRSGEDSPTLVVEGYASTFDPYDMYGGPERGGWIEQIATTAFDKTLREKPDLHLLINHEGMPLARTKSGNLKLSVDNHGLRVWAELDRSDPDVQRLEAKMRRGDMDEMSFAFRVVSETWGQAPGYDDPHSHRLISEVSLEKGDVSIVNWGANPHTKAETLKTRKSGVKRRLTLAEAQDIMRLDEKRNQRSLVEHHKRIGPALVEIAQAQRSRPAADLFASMDALDAQIDSADSATYRARLLAEQARRDAFDREMAERRWKLSQTAAVGSRAAVEALIESMCREEYARRDAVDAVLDAMQRAIRRRSR